MLLTPDLAQPIVERAMAILQRNVNIMDANGFIVGSGDPSRIGNLHQGAVAVLRTGRRVEIHPEDVPQWGGVRMGVNLALRLNGQIVGVVGITGLPDEVRPFGELIREMVQLMLGQARSAELERTMALAQESLLRNLLTEHGEISEQQVREAALLGLNQDADYAVLLCEPPPRPEPGDYAWVAPVVAAAEEFAAQSGIRPLLVTGPWDGRLVIVAGALAAQTVADLQRRLSEAMALAVGLPAKGLTGLRDSYRTAVLAREAGHRLSKQGVYRAEQMPLELLLSTLPPADAVSFFTRQLAGLPPTTTRSGQTLRQTLQAFFQHHLSAVETATALGIHRHTLTYRLDQVTTATGLDPRTWDGAVRLYLAVLLERLLGQMGELQSE